MNPDSHDYFAAHAGAPPAWFQKDFKQLRSLDLEVQWRWTYADAMVRAKSRFVLPEPGTSAVPVPARPGIAAGGVPSAVSGVATAVPPTPAAAPAAPAGAPARPPGAPPPGEELTLANPAFKKVEPAK